MGARGKVYREVTRLRRKAVCHYGTRIVIHVRPPVISKLIFPQRCPKANTARNELAMPMAGLSMRINDGF